MQPNSNRFSVMTLNLRFGLATDGPNAWKHRKKLLPHLFQSYPTDFIACQEANEFQVNDLSLLLDDYDLIGLRESAPTFWQNNIIFSKKDWAIQNREHFYLSETANIPSRLRDSRWPRQCTMGTFQKHSHRLTLINTHFDFEESVQTFSARLIMKRLRQRPDPLPAVLMGDFNAPFGSRHYQVFMDQAAVQDGLDLSFKNVFKSRPCGTHHGFTGKPGKDCIDWILHTDGITSGNATVVTDHVDGAYFSDHFPVVASFCFP